MTDDNLPDEAYFQLNTGWGTLEQTIGSGTKYHHTRQYTGLEREIERLRQALSHSNDVLRYYETKDGGHEAYCQRVENEAALKEADIARQALKETT